MDQVLRHPGVQLTRLIPQQSATLKDKVKLLEEAEWIFHVMADQGSFIPVSRIV